MIAALLWLVFAAFWFVVACWLWNPAAFVTGFSQGRTPHKTVAPMLPNGDIPSPPPPPLR